MRCKAQLSVFTADLVFRLIGYHQSDIVPSDRYIPSRHHVSRTSVDGLGGLGCQNRYLAGAPPGTRTHNLRIKSYIHQQSFDVSKRINALQSVVVRPFNTRGHSLTYENVGRNVGKN